MVIFDVHGFMLQTVLIHVLLVAGSPHGLIHGSAGCCTLLLHFHRGMQHTTK